MTALMYAAQEGHLAVAQYLMTQGADHTVRDQGGNDAKALAAKRYHTSIVRYFESLEQTPHDRPSPRRSVATLAPHLQSLVDPISHEAFTDPVIASDNHTYECQSIMKWWTECESQGRALTSPLTNEGMTKELRPNIVVKQILDEIAASRRLSSPPARTIELKSLADFGNIFKALDPLQNTLTSVAWPQIVVLGNENTGKSTLMSRLCMMPLFPTDKKLCTRMVIKVCLRRGARELLQLGVVPMKRCSRSSEPTMERTLTVSRENASDRIQQLMLEEVRAENGGQPVGICRDKMLVLHVVAPTVPNLDLVDLPGLLTARASGEPENMPQETRALAESYLDQYADQSIFLVTVPANAAANQSIAMEIIQQRGFEHRTIGVLTKCDLVDVAPDPDDEDEGEDKFAELKDKLMQASADVVRLEPHGYVAVMTKHGRSQGDSGHTQLAQQAQKEYSWFEQRDLFIEPIKGSLGTDSLLDRLQLVHNELWRELCLPTVLALLDAEIDRLAKEDQKLELPRGYTIQDLNVAELSREASALVRSLVNTQSSEFEAILKKPSNGESAFPSHYQGVIPVLAWPERLQQLQQHHLAVAAGRLKTAAQRIQSNLQGELEQWTSPFRPWFFHCVLKPELKSKLQGWLLTETAHSKSEIDRFYLAASNSVRDHPTDSTQIVYEIDLTGLNACILHSAVGALMKTLLQLTVSEDPNRWLESCEDERKVILERLQIVQFAKSELSRFFPTAAQQPASQRKKQRTL